MATQQLQQLINQLQLDPEFQGDAALQRLAQSIQTDLYALSQRPAPVLSTPVVLPPDQAQAWSDFLLFHQVLCEYAGFVNRDQWLHLVDVAADLLQRGPAGDTPYIGTNGNWWISGADTGVPAEGLAPHVGPNGNWWIATEDTGVPATGPPGPAGVPGSGLLILGSYPNAAALAAAHPTGPPQPGGCYLVGTTQPLSLYFWDTINLVWTNAGPMNAGIPEAPAGSPQPYARNGATQSWVTVTTNGGTF